MSAEQGPFKLLDNHSSDCDNQPDPFRNYECDNYTTCLSLAAALDWESFHCRGCKGEINDQLLWQARKLERQDKLVGQICHLTDEDSTISPAVANQK